MTSRMQLVLLLQLFLLSGAFRVQRQRRGRAGRTGYHVYERSNHHGTCWKITTSYFPIHALKGSSSSGGGSGSSGSEEDLPLLGDLEESCLSVGVAETRAESAILWEALKARKESLDQGIGKRYVCRTQKGFLNVHKEPGDPYNQDNVVSQLKDGDIIVSKGPPRGVGGWIQHDHGGWSVMMYRGFTFLELIEE